MADKIAVLIPCYNGSKTVAKVIRDMTKALPEAVIYVYDNNSSDRTVELAEKAGAVVRHEYMQGKGNVIRRMFREIDAEVYVMTDGDDTYPAEFAREMVDKVLEHQADMVFVLRDTISPTHLIPGLQMDGNHVAVNLQMETNLPGCFACGDLAGKPYQYIKSAGQGNVAALAAVGYLSSLKEK